MLIPGKYTVRASTWTFKPAKNKNWYLALTFMVIDGEHLGETVHGNLNFAWEAQSLRSQAVMRHLGWSGDDPTECHDNGGNLDRATIEVVVQYDTYNERTFPKIKDYILPNDIDRIALGQFFKQYKILPPSSSSNNIG